MVCSVISFFKLYIKFLIHKYWLKKQDVIVSKDLKTSFSILYLSIYTPLTLIMCSIIRMVAIQDVTRRHKDNV